MSEGERLGKESADLTEELPTQRLAQEAKSLLQAFAEKILASVGDKVSEKVNEVGQGLLEKAGNQDGGGPGVKAAVSGVKALTEGKGPVRAVLGAAGTGIKEKVKGFFGGGKGKKGQKFINIVETIDVGAPLRLVYAQWTQYEDFPNFMKKVEHVERPEEAKSNWKAQVFWSHRTFEATTLEQVPDDHIVWRSKGAKGYVDGAVSFSELAPDLTRICLVMEYHPQGMFERTGSLWRARGRQPCRERAPPSRRSPRSLRSPRKDPTRRRRTSPRRNPRSPRSPRSRRGARAAARPAKETGRGRAGVRPPPRTGRAGHRARVRP